MLIRDWITDLNIVQHAIKNWNPTETYAIKIREMVHDFVKEAESRVTLLERRQDNQHNQVLQLEMAVFYTKDAVCVTNSDHNIRLVNPAFETMTGYCGKDIVGKSISQLWKRENSDVEAMLSCLDRGNEWRDSLYIQRKDNQCLITEVTAVPLINANGTVSHIVYTIRDITQNSILENKIKQQNQLMQTILNSVSNIIIVLSPEGTMHLDNLAAKTLISDMGKSGYASLSSMLLQAIQEMKTNESKEIEIPFANGESGYYYMQSEKIPKSFLNIGSEKGFMHLVTLTDITGIKRKNQEIMIQEKALACSRIQKNLEQRELSNGFVYRVKEPLNVIEAVCQRMGQLADSGDIEGLQNNIHYLHESVEQMGNELNRFKKLSGPVRIRDGQCSSSELLEGLRIFYRELCHQNSLKFEIIHHSETIYPLPYEMMQILVSILVNNALESANKNSSIPHVRVISEQQPHQAVLIVEDSGAGLSEQDYYKIFEPLNGDSRAGLSLALLHQIMDHVDGKINIRHSSVLGGAAFLLCFEQQEQ